MSKSIMEQFAEIQKQANELKKLSEENTELTFNHVYYDRAGVLKVWQIKQ